MALRNTLFATTPTSVSGTALPLPMLPGEATVGPLHASYLLHEDEDARITGGTRSLNRRLLALNLDPVPSQGAAAVSVAPDRGYLPRSA